MSRAHRGFTLLEILVALAVLAIALGALVQTGGANAVNAAYLRDRTFAQWVATNKLSELQASRSWPELSNTEGTALLADHEWTWRMEVEDTDDADLRLVRVAVSDKPEGEPLITLQGYFGQH
jgi:general secretion pathway protein I